MKIPNNIIKTSLVRWRKLKWLQGELKSATDEDIAKLRTSLETHGFIRAFKVWNGYILDGHLLQKTMQAMEAAGVTIPDKLPAEHVRCKNIKAAKQLVLAYSSIYHRATDESLAQYLEEAEIEPAHVSGIIALPDIELAEPDKEVTFNAHKHHRIIIGPEDNSGKRITLDITCTITLECETKAQQTQIYRDLRKQEIECTKK